MARLYLRPVSNASQFSDLADYANNPPFTAPDGFEWMEGEPPESATAYLKLDPLQQLEQIITLGQQEMASNPLPSDIQKQIFDLELFVQNYYRRGAMALIQDSIQGFVIDDTRTDVTADQRNLVATLKNQMLGVFNGL